MDSNNFRSTTSCLVVAVLILISFASALMAQEEISSEAAEMTVLPGSVSFDAADFHAQLLLIVGGPDGVVSRQQAEVATSLSFGLDDEEGALRPDGLYAYELWGTPAADSPSILLRTGFFSIAEGSFVDPDLPEGFTKDQVIDDNLVVDGGLCVGVDCTDSESYLFTTARLKENNVRLEFVDTSLTTDEFPSNDWTLVINDSENGGADKFSIEDSSANRTPFTLLAGAPNNAMFIDADGDLGLGTSSPAVELHVADGDTPALRLDQDGSGSFDRHVWDIAGNETNFFVRDVTGGNLLPFKIEPGAANNTLVIDSAGEIGVGTRNPSAKLDVRGDIALTGTVDGRDIAADGSTLDAHVADFNNPHQVTAEQLGAIGQAELDAQSGDFNNPHQVTAEQVGAISQATLDAHTGDFNNPHQVTAEQVGAPSQSELDAHIGNFNNPHQVTASQTGADPAGTAAAAIAAHEAAFDHGNIPSALPVPVAEGGTGATDAATARANLGIEDDPSKTGILLAGSFTGDPATATVTFDTAYSAGTTYAVLLTPFSNDVAQSLTPRLISKDENGFSFALGGDLSALVEVGWMARPAAVATAVAITSPADSSSFAPSEDFEVNYVLSNAAGVRAYLGGAEQLVQIGSGPITLTAPPVDGPYELRLEAIDASGNELGTSDSVTIEVATAPPVAGISCALGSSDVWNNGYVLNDITVTNGSSETVNAWAVVLQFAESTTITNSWNAELTLSADGTTLDAVNTSNNGTLAPGQSTTFGLQGTHDGSFELPTCAGN